MLLIKMILVGGSFNFYPNNSTLPEVKLLNIVMKIDMLKFSAKFCFGTKITSVKILLTSDNYPVTLKIPLEKLAVALFFTLVVSIPAPLLLRVRLI